MNPQDLGNLILLIVLMLMCVQESAVRLRTGNLYDSDLSVCCLSCESVGLYCWCLLVGSLRVWDLFLWFRMLGAS